MENRWSLKQLAAILILCSSSALAAPLPRRGTLGIKIGGKDSAVVQGLLAGGAGEAAGLEPGDIILKAGSQPIATSLEFVRAASKLKPGDKIDVTFRRNGEEMTRTLTDREFPRETSTEFDVIYDDVTADGNRYRTIITKPKGDGPFPTLFFVPGVGCFTVDNPQSPVASHKPIADELTRRGYATLRVDKPGTGDSEGGPCPSVDFPTELHAYVAAVKSLAGKSFVDQRNVFLFGHSMGGVMAPLIAAEFPLRGIFVYGTVFNSWMYYMLETLRRQDLLGGADPADAAADEKKQELFTSLFYVQKMSLPDIIAKYPQFKEDFPDPAIYTAGKSGRYFQQIYDLNLAKSWRPYEGAVTAMWGASDFVSSESDHLALVAAINHWHPGHARFVVLPNTDHWLNKAADFAESLKLAAAGGEANPQFVEALYGFLQQTATDRAGNR